MTPDRILMLALIFIAWVITVLGTERRVRDRDWPSATRSALLAILWTITLAGYWLKVGR